MILDEKARLQSQAGLLRLNVWVKNGFLFYFPYFNISHVFGCGGKLALVEFFLEIGLGLACLGAGLCPELAGRKVLSANAGNNVHHA